MLFGFLTEPGMINQFFRRALCVGCMVLFAYEYKCAMDEKRGVMHDMVVKYAKMTTSSDKVTQVPMPH